MKIAICGSIAFIEEMSAARDVLLGALHEVEMPPLEVKNESGEIIPVLEYYRRRKAASDNDEWIWRRKAEAIHAHFDKIVWSDAILVLNLDKNGVEGYIGANTLLEMGLAFHYRKPIYLAGPIPHLPYREEILAMYPILLNGKLEIEEGKVV